MTKVIKHQLQLALQEQTKVGKLQLANAFYSSKYNIKRFLSEQEYIKTPLAVVKVDQSIDEFLR